MRVVVFFTFFWGKLAKEAGYDGVEVMGSEGWMRDRSWFVVLMGLFRIFDLAIRLSKDQFAN